MEQKTPYIICCTQRCGSNFLSSGLYNSKIAGNPDELFLDHVRRRLGIDYDLLDIQRLMAETMTPNGVFGVRIMWGTFQELIQKLKQDNRYKQLPAASIVATVFQNPHYIYLTRKDKIRQAISYYKARKTNEWIKSSNGKTAGPPRQTKSPHNQLKFNFKEINHLMKILKKDDVNWENYFRENNIDFSLVVYEDLVENYEKTILALFNKMKIEVPDNHPPIRSHLVKQADSLSDEWAIKYHRKAKLYDRFKPLLKFFQPH